MLDVISKAYVRMLNPNQLLTESVLMENRIDWLKQNTKSINIDHDMMAVHIEPHAIINFMANHVDPTRNKVHTQHLIRMYNNGAFRQEDAPRVKETLSNFEKYKSKLPVEQRDLGRYHSISSIQDAVEPHIGTGATKKESRELLKNKLNIPGKHELKYDDDKISIYHLKDRETSQKLYAQKTANVPGAYPTEWCTAAAPPRDHNMFDHYHSRGNMFVIHRKSDGAVFQYHPESNQFMDKADNTISNQDFESIKPSLHKAWDDKDKNLLDNTEANANSAFLDKYAEQDRHYSFENSPLSYLKQNNKNITSEQLHYAIKPNQQLSVRRAAIKHPNITSDHINKALDDPEQSVKIFAIGHKNATRENIHKALEDTDTDVARAALQNANTDSSVITKALNHTDASIRYMAMLNPAVTSEHIDKALTDPDESVRNIAIDSEHVNTNHIDKALKDSNSGVRLSAINNPKFNEHHFKTVINDDKYSDHEKQRAVANMIAQKKKVDGIDKIENLYIDHHLNDISDNGLKLAKHYAHNLRLYPSHGITSEEVMKYMRPDVNEAAKIFANKIGESEMPKFGRMDQRTAASLSVFMKHRALDSEHIKHIANHIINRGKGEYNHIGAIEALYDNRLKPEHAKEIVDAANKYDSPYNEQINNTYKRRFVNK